MKDFEAERRRAAEAQKKQRAVPAAEPPKPARRRLCWKEQREMEQLEKDMEEGVPEMRWAGERAPRLGCGSGVPGGGCTGLGALDLCPHS